MPVRFDAEFLFPGWAVATTGITLGDDLLIVTGAGRLRFKPRIADPENADWLGTVGVSCQGGDPVKPEESNRRRLCSWHQ